MPLESFTDNLSVRLKVIVELACFEIIMLQGFLFCGFVDVPMDVFQVHSEASPCGVLHV